LFSFFTINPPPDESLKTDLCYTSSQIPFFLGKFRSLRLAYKTQGASSFRTVNQHGQLPAHLMKNMLRGIPSGLQRTRVLHNLLNPLNDFQPVHFSLPP
jgi:hypothetical protein